MSVPAEPITVALARRLGAFSLDVAFTAGPGLTALFGRSGSGKTSVISLMAGLVRPDRGRIAVGDEVLLDTARGIDVPVHRRRIATVFQEARLLPHLSVRRNLGYGRFFARRRPGPAVEVAAVVEMLGIGHLLERRPAGLSGGERQRVAIGRALLAKPRLLLMDEPLAALDEARKAEILPYIERLRDEAGVPIVYVSHALAEVARLAGTVVVLEEGRVAAAGPADAVLRRADLLPAHAGEAGAILAMTIAAQDLDGGLTRLSGPAGPLVVPHLARPVGARVRVRVPARDVLVATQVPVGLSARNVLPGRISALDARGGGVMVEIDCNGVALAARLTGASVRDLGLAPGLPVYAIIKSVAFDPTEVGHRPVEI